jgi:hypothetical protein
LNVLNFFSTRTGLIFRRHFVMVVAALLAAGGSGRANLINTTSYTFAASADGGTAGNVQQTFSTVAGEQYQISFQGNLSSVYTPTTLNFWFGNRLNASLVDTLAGQYYQWYFQRSDTSLVNFNYLVTADAASSALGFQYYLTSENYGMTIRNFTVNRVPDGATTAALLSAGLTTVFATRRWLNRSR